MERQMLGERIRAARHAVGLTAATVAERLGVSASLYSNWETGRRRLGSEDLIRLAAVLGTSPMALLGDGAPQNYRHLVAVALNRQLSVMEVHAEKAKILAEATRIEAEKDKLAHANVHDLIALLQGGSEDA